jgi:threonine aldolase
MINLESDVVANPTSAMRQAMAAHEMGEYLDNGDWSVLELERSGAEMFGKEASIFLPTVTMSNLIACMYYCRPGDQVILDADAHVYLHELGGMARIAGVIPRVVPRLSAMPDLEAVERTLSHRNMLNETPAKMVWVENTHNAAGGAVATLAELEGLRTLLKGRNIVVHVDGARIFNAAVAMDVSLAELTAPVDSISVSFNKSMACPFGSLLIGSKSLIEAAVLLRRMLGGRMVKSGAVAAACTVALKTMIERVAEDHASAQKIGNAIKEISGLKLEGKVVTNIIRFDTSELTPARTFIDMLAREGVLMGVVGRTSIRAVTHHEITKENARSVVNAIRTVATKLKSSTAKEYPKVALA